MYWLQGFFEVSGAKTLDEDQTLKIRMKLESCFEKVTAKANVMEADKGPPYYIDPNFSEKANEDNFATSIFKRVELEAPKLCGSVDKKGYFTPSTPTLNKPFGYVDTNGNWISVDTGISPGYNLDTSFFGPGTLVSSGGSPITVFGQPVSDLPDFRYGPDWKDTIHQMSPFLSCGGANQPMASC